MKWLIIGLFYTIGGSADYVIIGNPHDNLEVCLQAMGKIVTDFGAQAKEATPSKVWNKIGNVGYQCIREDIYEAVKSQKES